MLKYPFGAARSSPVSPSRAVALVMPHAGAEWRKNSGPPGDQLRPYFRSLDSGRSRPVQQVVSGRNSSDFTKLLLALLSVAEVVLGIISLWIGISTLWNARGLSPLYLICGLTLLLGTMLIIQAGLTIFLLIKGYRHLIYLVSIILIVLFVLTICMLTLMLSFSADELQTDLEGDLNKCISKYRLDAACEKKLDRIQLAVLF